MDKNIAVIRGDGIGPEVVSAAVCVLAAVEKRFGCHFVFNGLLMGGAAIDAVGEPLPEHTLKSCLASDAVLLGAVGGPKWEGLPGFQRPEKGLLALRAGMGLYANMRPAKLVPALAAASPLRADIARDVDILVVRELTGGVYFGEHKTVTEGGETRAVDIMAYSESEIDRIVRVGFESAMKRRKKLCSVDKANVLDTSRLWRKIVRRVAADYPEVAYSDMLVDNAAMQIVRCPAQFDVIVTENLFGDILSDEASMLTGSIGMLPSASLGAPGVPGLYEPIHGSAPDIAGKNVANPVGAILCAAMMLRYSLSMPSEADAIEAAVEAAVAEGLRTADIAGQGETPAGCAQAAEIIAQKILE